MEVKSVSCIYPVLMHRLAAINPETGKNITVHQLKAGMNCIESFYRPCQYCIECRLTKSRYTAVRCLHTASLYEDNSFITLTFDNENLPKDRSLASRHLQLFWKKLRKEISPTLIKYFAAGEYGEGDGERYRYTTDPHGKIIRTGDNPHYHACLFNYDFSDKKPSGKNQNGDTLYSSEMLTKIWGNGRCDTGSVTFESAAYVARYSLKKIYGDSADKHYDGRMPERSYWSKGLGRDWFSKWGQDVYATDTIVVRGKEMKPPPYYDKILLSYNPQLYEQIKDQRKKITNSKNNVDMSYNLSQNRPMAVSEIVRNAQLRVGGLDKKRN